LKEELGKLRGDKGLEENSSVNDPLTFKNVRPEHDLGYERDAYEALCRGDDVISFKILLSSKQYKIQIQYFILHFKIPNTTKNPKLYCRYVNHKPFLIIGPVKEELVNINPNIWVYHDVLTKKQVETFKSLANPKVKFECLHIF
jgi:hypothetical protein